MVQKEELNGPCGPLECLNVAAETSTLYIGNMRVGDTCKSSSRIRKEIHKAVEKGNRTFATSGVDGEVNKV